MSKKEYLEYLCLDSIIQGYVTADHTNTYDNSECCILFSNHMTINVQKLRARIIELQKKLLKEYEL